MLLKVSTQRKSKKSREIEIEKKKSIGKSFSNVRA